MKNEKYLIESIVTKDYNIPLLKRILINLIEIWYLGKKADLVSYHKYIIVN